METNNCGFCGKPISDESKGFVLKCKHCSEFFCGNHSSPENHDCSVFKMEKILEEKEMDMYKKTYDKIKRKQLLKNLLIMSLSIIIFLISIIFLYLWVINAP